MATFKDKHGRSWLVELDVFLLEQVINRTAVRLDLILAEKNDVYAEIVGDPVKAVRVLWVLVEEQAEKSGITPEHFGRSLAGDCLENARGALLEAIADFSPRHQRKLLKALVAKTDEVAEKATRVALLKVDAAIAKAEAEAEAKTGPSSEPATSSPASSESTLVLPEG